MQALQVTLILKQHCDVEKRGPALSSPRGQRSLLERFCKAAPARADPGSAVIMWEYSLSHLICAAVVTTAV